MDPQERRINIFTHMYEDKDVWKFDLYDWFGLVFFLGGLGFIIFLLITANWSFQ